MPDHMIAVAMSGGVDSSVAAGLLRSRGEQVLGLTMHLWDRRRLAGSPESVGTEPDSIRDAKRVAGVLGIPHSVVNLETRFEERVVRPFIDEYLAGRTPIPCACCNRAIKFGALMDAARSVGADRLATGHYARILRDDKTGRYLLLRGVDEARDQSYFLFGLTQEQLAVTLFPLGEYPKQEIRSMAEAMRLPVAQKDDSQEICFIPDGDYGAFIDSYFQEQGIAVPDTRGEIVSTSGRVLGEHRGVHHFTVGQRRGLGIAAGEPLYVISTDPASRRVIVGQAEELFRRNLTACEVNWIAFESITGPVRAAVKIRNKHTAALATVEPGGDPTRATVTFDEPQRAVTPGQAAVFYDGDLVLGGGWIK